MKITQATLAFTLLATGAASDESATKSKGVRRRQLRALQDDSFSLPTEAIDTAPVEYECNQPEAWHRDTAMDWADGTCVLNVDCEETSYASEGECCAGAYANQWSKACLKKMPDYDEAADVAELAMAECTQDKAWHRDTAMDWADGTCVFNVDCEATSYASEGECCAGAYANQWSKACLKKMPDYDEAINVAEFDMAECDQPEAWHRDTSVDWADGTCVFNVDCEETSYASEGECCAGAYASQFSEACIKDMPEAERPVPATIAKGTELDMWWPDWTRAYEYSVCTNVAPMPDYYIVTYATAMECCAAHFADQELPTCTTAAAKDALGDALGDLLGFTEETP